MWLPAMVIVLLLGLGHPAPSVAAADGAGAEQVQRLLAAADAGKWAWAQRLAEGTGSAPLRAYVRWRELLESTDQPPFTAYREFLRRSPDWPSLGRLQARAEEGLDGTEPYAARLAFFADRAPRTRQGRQALAEAQLAAGRTADAVALLRRSWIDDDFAAAEESTFLDRFGSYLRPADHAARLDRLLWDGRIEQAQRLLGRVPERERAVAGARIALQLAAPGVDRTLAALPATAQREAGLAFDRLRWRAGRGNPDGVLEILLRPPEALGEPARWWEEQQRAIRAAIGQRSFKLAYRLASVTHQPPGTAFAEAEWLAGWLALRFNGEPGLARRHFERLWPVVTTPISRARAGYWAGRAAAAVGEAQAAAAWYRRAATYAHTFYGQLAMAELGVDPADRVGPKVLASAAAREQLRRRTPAELTRLFCRVDQPERAQPFLRHLGYEAAGDPNELAAVVDLARGCDRAALVLTVTRAAASNGAYLVRDAFPVPSRPAFHVADAVEPALVLAVARQESLFDPAARSPVGALGLMQLMPSTAQAMARASGLPFSRLRLVADPAYNVRLGAGYLATQLDLFDQEPALALAAYNAGPGRVADWLRLNGDPRGADRHELIDWIELIPFAETRNYVQRVLEARDMYRLILAPPKVSADRVASDAPPTVLPRPKPAS